MESTSERASTSDRDSAPDKDSHFDKGSDSEEEKTSVNLAELAARYQITGQVLHFSAAPERRYEHFPFGPSHKIDKADLEDQLVSTLAEIKQRYEDADIIMVVYNFKAEFAAMQRLFPAAAGYFNGWIDLFGRHGSRRDVGGVGCTGTLGHSMCLLNFDKQHLPPSNMHSPGMDAVRTLGVLIELLSRPNLPCMQPLPRNPPGRGRRKKKNLQTRFLGKMPPREKFPHKATMTVMDKNNIATTFPDNMNHPDGFWDFWHHHFAEPSAVGLQKFCSVKDGLVVKTAQTGYVCFNSEETLNLFVQQWDGRQISEATRVVFHSVQKGTLRETIRQFRKAIPEETQHKEAAGAISAAEAVPADEREGDLSEEELIIPGWFD